MIRKSVFLLIGLALIVSATNNDDDDDDFNPRDGFFCNGVGSYNIFNNWKKSHMLCPLGQACQCPKRQHCSDPCTPTCETLLPFTTRAQEFCQARINNFTGKRAEFCNPEGSGFYECIRDAFCPNKASLLSVFVPCPDNTKCMMNNTHKKAKNGGFLTPCKYVPPKVNQCAGYTMLDCVTFNTTLRACTGPCQESMGADPTTYCFQNANTRQGVCAVNFACDNPTCTQNSDCAGSNMVCIINSCCGAGGVCTTACA